MTAPPALTRNQQIVLTALDDAGRPLSAYDLLATTAVRDGGLNAPVTIYRALDKLQEKGLVHRIASLNAFVVCAHADCPHAEPAAFMICEVCRKATELRIGDLVAGLMDHARAEGFGPRAVHIEVTGRCMACTGGTPA